MCCSCLPTSTTANGNILKTPGQLPLQDTPQTMPTVVLGDFNDDVSTASSSHLLRMMSSKGFSQLVKVPTTDSGSLLDHIYYTGTTTNVFIDVVDTYYSDHVAAYISIPATPPMDSSMLFTSSVCSFHSSTSTRMVCSMKSAYCCNQHPSTVPISHPK